MRLTSYAISATGLTRPENQDNLYINGVFREDLSDNSPFRYTDAAGKHGFYAVADGMGGEAYGALAALTAVQAVGGVNLTGGHQRMVDYLIERNAIICNMIMMNDGARIGSTFVGLNIIGDCVELTNIGDSRAYLYRDRKMSILSRDHTPTRKMVELGVISEEDARRHPDRHRLTQHLGVFPAEMPIEPYTASMELKGGDLFLLCSDGLTDMLDDAEIRSTLESSATTENKAEMLFGGAIKAGGKDNITIILVQVRRIGLRR